ncbi:BgtTE-56038 [Blumeria graminis f. sp. tritici]|uniref:BgtTE-56038 n=1 Tax=Blumeria graminis f. sp. tritici TaxID=62690 RepID=A0A9X9MG07_BLUGR|nr:BgtTE-56038 [Blumeria graminis f. sp. tritici]
MVRWYIVLAGLPSRVWIAWTHIPLETVDRWFKSGKHNHISRGASMHG